jgi:KUP system potassium uptake protein
MSVDTPYVPKKKRVSLEELGQGFYRLVASYGFMQTPKMPEILNLAREQGLEIDIHATSFYLGRETLITSGDTKMAAWRKSLFTFLSRNAWNVSTYFGIPPDRVVELGSQVEI